MNLKQTFSKPDKDGFQELLYDKKEPSGLHFKPATGCKIEDYLFELTNNVYEKKDDNPTSLYIKLTSTPKDTDRITISRDVGIKAEAGLVLAVKKYLNLTQSLNVKLKASDFEKELTFNDGFYLGDCEDTTIYFKEPRAECKNMPSYGTFSLSYIRNTELQIPENLRKMSIDGLFYKGPKDAALNKVKLSAFDINLKQITFYIPSEAGQFSSIELEADTISFEYSLVHHSLAGHIIVKNINEGDRAALNVKFCNYDFGAGGSLKVYSPELSILGQSAKKLINGKIERNNFVVAPYAVNYVDDFSIEDSSVNSQDKLFFNKLLLKRSNIEIAPIYEGNSAIIGGEIISSNLQGVKGDLKCNVTGVSISNLTIKQGAFLDLRDIRGITNYDVGGATPFCEIKNLEINEHSSLSYNLDTKDGKLLEKDSPLYPITISNLIVEGQSEIKTSTLASFNNSVLNHAKVNIANPSAMPAFVYDSIFNNNVNLSHIFTVETSELSNVNIKEPDAFGAKISGNFFEDIEIPNYKSFAAKEGNSQVASTIVTQSVESL